MGKDGSNDKSLALAIEGSIRDSFMNYGGAPNVVDSLNKIAESIEKLADAGL